jgi:uncharacterized membrane protein YsdA (DUF1294 family)
VEKSEIHAAGQITGTNLATLALLLIAPLLAVGLRFGATTCGYAAGWLVLVSLLTFLGYSSDKRRARRGEWRAAESTLHLGELAGGWPGAFLAQRKFRHKTSKLSYQFVFWLIVGLYEFVAIDSLLGWAVLGSLF